MRDWNACGANRFGTPLSVMIDIDMRRPDFSFVSFWLLARSFVFLFFSYSRSRRRLFFPPWCVFGLCASN